MEIGNTAEKMDNSKEELKEITMTKEKREEKGKQYQETKLSIIFNGSFIATNTQ